MHEIKCTSQNARTYIFEISSIPDQIVAITAASKYQALKKSNLNETNKCKKMKKVYVENNINI